jgi:hypothetical protein
VGDPELVLVAVKLNCVQVVAGNVKLGVGATQLCTVITCEAALVPEALAAIRIMV